MMIGSLVRYANKVSTDGRWFSQLTLDGNGTWNKSVRHNLGQWKAGDIGIIVDITCRHHRKAIVMRDNEFYEIALKHLEQVSKTSIAPKRKKS